MHSIWYKFGGVSNEGFNNLQINASFNVDTCKSNPIWIGFYTVISFSSKQLVHQKPRNIFYGFPYSFVDTCLISLNWMFVLMSQSAEIEIRDSVQYILAIKTTRGSLQANHIEGFKRARVQACRSSDYLTDVSKAKGAIFRNYQT